MDKQYFNAEQLASFDRDGFVVIRTMYEADEIRLVSQWIDELEAMPMEVGKQMHYFEDSLLNPGEKILSRIEKFADYHQRLGQFVRSEKLLKLTEAVIGEPVTLFKEKVNFKMSGGAGFEPHQDIQPGWDDYSPYFVSVLIAVDENTLENGCLELAAGFHKKGLIGRKWQPLEGKELVGIQFKPYPMAPGDVAIFDCFVPHQSKPNKTKTRRRNLYLTYNSVSSGESRERYFADKRKSYPPDNEREPGKEYSYKV